MSELIASWKGLDVRISVFPVSMFLRRKQAAQCFPRWYLFSRILKLCLNAIVLNFDL